MDYFLLCAGELVSSKLAAGTTSNNVATRLRLENERLKREVSELRKLVSASGAPISTPAGDPIITPHPDLDSLEGPEKIKALELELTQTREALASKSSNSVCQA